jgi:long-chain acyl-CoA synthetase
MDGYLDHPDETREVLRDGWYRTGDLGTVLPGGFVRLSGRKRERILRGGYSVFPQEVEAVLLSHSAIAEAAVVGVPHTDLGEEVAAFIALKPAMQVSREVVLAYCKERLAHYKYPRQIEILPELPRGLTGKILKSELLKRSTPH